MRKITIIKGDLLEAKEDIICHQVNCKGVMGSGLAKQIRAKHLLVYMSYINYCRQNSSFSLLGKVQFVKDFNKEKIVANIFGQLNYGRNGNCYTDYSALTTAFNYLKTFAEDNNKSIAIPYEIGCGLGGGDWGIVLSIIENIFADGNVDVIIYQLDR